jgi:hypothetical protein
LTFQLMEAASRRLPDSRGASPRSACREDKLMSAHQHHAAIAAAPDSIVRDPVCGMTVDAGADKPMHVHDGRTFHFCSQAAGTGSPPIPKRTSRPRTQSAG